MKPGDWGEDTISLHVNNNDAYLCADVTLRSDDDNTPTEPELADDLTPTTGVGNGELADAVNFYWWADDGDNVFETCDYDEPVQGCVNENLIPSGPLGVLDVGDTTTVALADSQTNIWGYIDTVSGNGAPLPGNTLEYVGKAWCFGDSEFAAYDQDGLGSGNNNGPIQRPVVCSGANEENETQTDSMTADISFSAVQSRNNSTFVCGQPEN